MNIADLLLDILIMIISGLLITKSVRYFISSSTKLAHLMRISTYTISFFLISLGTTLPELVVSITSGIEKNTILAYGNAVGSNLALITLIISLPVVLGGRLSTKDVVKSKDIYWGAFFLLISLVMALDGIISRLDGIILLLCYVVYTHAVLRRGNVIEAFLEKFEHTNAWKQGVLFALSLIILLIASEGIVHSAISLSKILNLNLGYIGLTITAIGTSLPEISFAIGIVGTRKHQDEILGNVIGSVVSNSTLVLGTAAVIFPIKLGLSHLGFPTIIMLVCALMMFLAFSKSDENISKNEAYTLLAVYFLFLGLEYFLVR